MNSAQPSRSSVRNRWRTGFVNASRIAARKEALTAKVAASTAIAQPVLEIAITTPAAAGPRIAVTLRESDIIAFAWSSRSGRTVCGTRPCEAGPKNASAAP